LDVATLDGATIQVPLSTTRISTKGLNLCGVAGSVPPPTDIAYILDQTGSMVPTAIFPGSEDTTGWFECNCTNCTDPVASPVIKYIDTIQFHGYKVSVVDPATKYGDLQTACKVAGDPYSVRLSTVQNAIRFQASKSPQSYASIISFHGVLDAVQMTMTPLSTSQSVENLVTSIPLKSGGGTNYEEPITWARIQLYGGKSGNTIVAPSVDSNKAIIMISDGRPNQGKWREALAPTNTVDWNKKTWTTTSTRIPPIYTIYLGVDSVAGSSLDTVASMTGGKYYQIPPNMPDSLTRVIQQILGMVIKPATPDSLFVTNTTNGQASHSTVVTPKSGSYLMALDSLAPCLTLTGLQPDQGEGQTGRQRHLGELDSSCRRFHRPPSAGRTRPVPGRAVRTRQRIDLEARQVGSRLGRHGRPKHRDRAHHQAGRQRLAADLPVHPQIDRRGTDADRRTRGNRS